MKQSKAPLLAAGMAGAAVAVWLGMAIAPGAASGLRGMLEAFSQAMADPFEVTICADTGRCVLVCLFVYGLALLVLVSDRMNFRRGEEYGSARWGNPREIDRKYRDRKAPSANLILTQHVAIGNSQAAIYDLTKEKMKYLGYEFYVFKPPPKCVQQKGMYMVANTLPQKKEDEIVDRCRELLRAVRKHPNFETIHDWNTYVVGIHNYYKGMTHFCINFRKIGWRIKKLFYHTMERNVTFTKEQSYKNNFQRGGYRSLGNNGYYCFNGYPVVEIQWASWDSWLLAGGNGVVKRENPYSQKERKQRPGVSIDDIEYLVRVSKHIKSSRLALFRISKYSSTKGISYLSGEYVPVGQYHCHHIKPLKNGGTNDFNNLCVLSELEHTILHSTTPERLYDLFPKKKKRIKALIEALYDKAA